MFERGDLLLVPCPFSDLSASKRRPVLALTIPDSHGDFIALQVTSRAKLEHALAIANSDLVEGALPVASFIRTDRIVTLNASLVTRVFGRVSERVVSEAVERFCVRIGYAPR